MDQELKPCLQAGSRFGKLCFSHDSRYLFCCCGSVVKVFNATSGECVHDLKAHTTSVSGVFLNPTNALQLFSCGQDGRLIVWDYLDGDKLKEHDLRTPLYGIISINAETKSIMMIAKTEPVDEKFSLIQWKQVKSETSIDWLRSKTLINDCSNDCGLVSFGCSREFVASGFENKLTVYSMKKDKTRVLVDTDKYNKKSDITSVACHPNEFVIAVGLNNGKILLWHNFFTNEPVISRLHWHALPCLSLAFSPDGSNLLSGGHECVLVKWQMGSSEHMDFKPRMGAPLTQVLCSPDGTLYATEHSDNVVQLLNVNLKVLQVYRGLTRSSISVDPHSLTNDPIPCGLQYDPRSQALVTNGLPGHLQFYSLPLNRQLYNLDIVCQNYISPENVFRPSVITKVTSVALSDRGEWLATFEIWDDGHFTPEQRLKFWSWSSEAQTYSLNTTVECPHDGKVTSMIFRPCLHCSNQTPSLVTMGTDFCFKKWTLVDDTDIYRSNMRWDCESVGFYRGLDANCGDFSSDSTALAVGFCHLVTLWDPDNNIVHATLSHNLPHRQPIRYLLFGNKDSSNYLVAATSDTLIIWDVLSLTVSWKLDAEISLLIKDPVSDLMAFVSDKSVTVFRPSSSSIVYSHPNVSQSPILSAVFIPNGRHRGIADVGWPGTSQIYFFNAFEELFTLDFHQQQNDKEKIKLAQNLPPTAMQAFMAEKQMREGGDAPVNVSLNNRQKTDEEFITALLHSNEPVSTMCHQFLKTLLVKRYKPPSTELGKDMDDTEDESGSSDSEMETDDENNAPDVSAVTKVAVTKAPEIKVQKEPEEDMDKLLSKSLDWIKWCENLKLQ